MTMTESAGPGHVRVWANGAKRPDTSAVNTSAAGQTVANHAVAAVGSTGVNLFAAVGTHVIVDVTGFWTSYGTTTPTTPTTTTTPTEPTDPTDPTTPTTPDCGACGRPAFQYIGMVPYTAPGEPTIVDAAPRPYWSNPRVAGCTFEEYGFVGDNEAWFFNAGCTGTTGFVDFELIMSDGSHRLFAFTLYLP
jgi:hypothetical protein